MDEKQEAEGIAAANAEIAERLGEEVSVDLSTGNGSSAMDFSAEEIRSKIQNADDVRFEDVPVEEWGVVVRVFSMSGRERGEMLQGLPTNDDGEMIIAAAYPAILRTTCYAPKTGKHPQAEHRVFDEASDAWLSEKASGPLERVAETALRMSGLDKEARDRAGKGSRAIRR